MAATTRESTSAPSHSTRWRCSRSPCQADEGQAGAAAYCACKAVTLRHNIVVTHPLPPALRVAVQERDATSVRDFGQDPVQVLRKERHIALKEAVPNPRKNELGDGGGETVLTDARPPVREGQVLLKRLFVQVLSKHCIVLGRHRNGDLLPSEVNHVVGHRSSQSTVRT